jgi:hypothetical protein
MEVEKNSGSCSIKVSFGDDLRRFNFSGNDFCVLQETLAKIFNLSGPFLIKYLDDEKELVTMSSDAEFLCAIHLAKGPLRLQIFPKTVPSVEIPVSYPSLEALSMNNCIPSPVFRPVETLPPRNVEMKDVSSTVPEFKKGGKYGYGGHHHHPGKEKFKKGKSRFVKDVTVEDNTSFAPQTPFVKTWRVRNEGMNSWVNCALKFKKGDRLATSEMISVPNVAPNEEIDISVPMVAPSQPGKYSCVLKMVNSFGIPFGQALKMKIRVPSPDSSSSSSDEEHHPKNKAKEDLLKEKQALYSTQLSYLKGMGFTDDTKNLKLLIKSQGNIDKVVVKLLKKRMKNNE